MILSRGLRTANFLQLNAARPFAWGDWDCNLFIVDLLDHIDAGMPWRSQAIRGKYDSGFGAARFQYFFTPAPKWLEQQGYEIVRTEQFQEHDIILEARKRYWSANLFFAGHTWAVIENRGLMRDVIEPGTYTIARLKNG